MSTNVIICSSYQLNSVAWLALLEKQPRLSPIAAIRDASEAEHYLHTTKKGTILLDVWEEPLDYVRRIRAVTADWGILVLVPAYDLRDIVAFLQAGAMGCLARDAAVGDLARSLIATARGEIALPPAIATQALLALARGNFSPEQPAITLSPREEEVISLLAKGLTNKEIAQSLVLSVRTIEAHLRSVFNKLDLQSRTEAALWAVRHGYGEQIR